MYFYINYFEVRREQGKSLKSTLTVFMLCQCVICMNGTEGSRTWEIQEGLIKVSANFLSSRSV